MLVLYRMHSDLMYVLAFSPGNFSMHVEQVGVSMEDTSSQWSLNWGDSYQLVCWTGESSHTFFWRGAGSFNVVSAPPLHNWH